MRKLYDERTNLAVKDLSEQGEEKYVALISNLGEKSAIAFDKMIMNPETIVLLAKSPNPDSIKPEQGPMVAAFPTRSDWVVVRRDRFIEMNGVEYSKYMVDEAKKQKELAEAAYGKDGTYIAVLPNGRQIILPLTKDVSEEIEKQTETTPQQQAQAQPKFPAGPEGGYL